MPASPLSIKFSGDVLPVVPQPAHGTRVAPTVQSNWFRGEHAPGGHSAKHSDGQRPADRTESLRRCHRRASFARRRQPRYLAQLGFGPLRLYLGVLNSCLSARKSLNAACEQAPKFDTTTVSSMCLSARIADARRPEPRRRSTPPLSRPRVGERSPGIFARLCAPKRYHLYPESSSASFHASLFLTPAESTRYPVC